MARLSIPLNPGRTGRLAEALETGLRDYIVGQDEAIRKIVGIYQMYMAGLAAPGRPVGSFLFLGPTGSGKTRIVEALAQILAGTAGAVVKVDCAEFQHSHEVAKLIGSPPGYLGHRETHPLLSPHNLDQFHTDTMKLSFVLFDEIEKATDALWNLLLGILDKATLTLGDNTRVDFSSSMIFLTSNLGAREMSSILNPNWGFAAAEALRNGPVPAGKISQIGVEASRRKFTPEFMNRLDKIVTFNPLDEAALGKILDIELDFVRQRIATSPLSHPFTFSLSEDAREYVLSEGSDAKYGARHLKRAIERLVVQPMSNLIATGQISEGDAVTVDFDRDLQSLVFFRSAEAPPPLAAPRAIRAAGRAAA
jgi:ATP-dependent Clp protease ATP-binding subunit ClpA